MNIEIVLVIRGDEQFAQLGWNSTTTIGQLIVDVVVNAGGLPHSLGADHRWAIIEMLLKSPKIVVFLGLTVESREILREVLSRIEEHVPVFLLLPNAEAQKLLESEFSLYEVNVRMKIFRMDLRQIEKDRLPFSELPLNVTGSLHLHRRTNAPTVLLIEGEEVFTTLYAANFGSYWFWDRDLTGEVLLWHGWCLYVESDVVGQLSGRVLSDHPTRILVCKRLGPDNFNRPIDTLLEPYKPKEAP